MKNKKIVKDSEVLNDPPAEVVEPKIETEAANAPEEAVINNVPAEEVTEALTPDEKFNPEKNHDAISIIKDPDGNWSGSMWKNSRLITVREAGPQTAIQMLLTHE